MVELKENIAVWARGELKKKEKGRRKMWVQPIICDRGNKGYFGLFLKI
jgi:hypothetical protein